MRQRGLHEAAAAAGTAGTALQHHPAELPARHLGLLALPAGRRTPRGPGRDSSGADVPAALPQLRA